MRALSEIAKDIELCAEYERTGTLQAAFKELKDIRTNLLDLVQYIQWLGEEVGKLRQPEGLERSDGTHEHEHTQLTKRDLAAE
jgi:hypothetical protein